VTFLKGAGQALNRDCSKSARKVESDEKGGSVVPTKKILSPPIQRSICSPLAATLSKTISAGHFLCILKTGVEALGIARDCRINWY
jgi:hypothetical protein